MCGIVGVISNKNIRNCDWPHKMIKSLKHRGPDSDGCYIDKNIFLGHVRLSILDLSSLGSQPMHYENLVLVYNGEIYNYLELKEKLIGVKFNGNSDTEVLIKYCYHFGVERFLNDSNGMFAFALFDKSSNKLFLCRDRAGEKPLYYGWTKNKFGSSFIFSSELKSFNYHPEFEKIIDHDSLSNFFKYNYIGGSKSIFSGINKVSPGSYIKIDFTNQNTEIKKYFSYQKLNCEDDLRFVDYDFSKQNLKKALINAVNIQYESSDVGVGCFLSGGIDSSLITSLLQSNKRSKNSIKTFSIGFNDSTYDEAKYAKEIASFLKTDHHELYLDKNDLIDIIPKLSHVYDEPFSDSSQIPTMLVSKFAREYVPVVLSGDAGDELFGGYTRYL